jgi:hypothetical protein
MFDFQVTFLYISKNFIYFPARVTPICRVPQLMSVLLTEFISALEIFSVFVEIDFVVMD